MKISNVIVLVGFLAIGIYAGITTFKLDRERANSAMLQLRGDSTVTLLDSSRAMLASSALQRDSLNDALQAAKVLNGKLIAAVNVALHQKPTVDTVTVGTVAENGERRLVVNDTSENGILDANIFAPRYPENIQFAYAFYPAPINATIGLVQLQNDSVVFTVRYRGGTVNLSTPYANIPKRQKRFSPYLEGLYDLTVTRQVVFRGGVDITAPFLKNTFLITEVQQLIGSKNTGSVFVGLKKSF